MGAIGVEPGTRCELRVTRKKETADAKVCAAYKSYNIPGALEAAVAPREGWRIRTPSIRLARGLTPPAVSAKVP